MGSSFGGFANTATNPDFRFFGVARNLFVPWDMTRGPKNNRDKIKKYGSQDGSHAIAFREFDFDGFKHGMNRAVLADGFTGADPTEVSSYALFDPDSWVLRMHDKEGKGEDSCWSVRLQTDHNKKAKEREHRSTIFVDNCEDQKWAWAQDLTWIINLKTKTSVTHDEIKFDKAGFLPQLKTKGKKGEKTRGALALNISKKGGFVTDGVQYGQLWHVLNLQSVEVVSGSQVETETDGCADVEEGQLALRGDVLFDTKFGLAPLAIVPPVDVTYGKILTGMHWVNTPSPSPPPKEISTDSSSNHSVSGKSNPYGVWVYVEDDDWGIPPWEPVKVGASFPDKPATVGEPSSVDRGAFTVKRFPDNSGVTGLQSVLAIPEEIQGNTNWGVTVDVNFVTPSGGFTSTVDLQMDYAVIGLGDDASPSSKTGTLTQTINAATHAGSEVVRRHLFHIPWADLQAKSGGKLAFAIYRRADTDGDADDFDYISMSCHYGPEITDAGR
tara:strand:+ start:37 stop:1527 length:1491 start_codon:yes stop_codon:yes gene_type:complete